MFPPLGCFVLLSQPGTGAYGRTQESRAGSPIAAVAEDDGLWLSYRSLARWEPVGTIGLESRYVKIRVGCKIMCNGFDIGDISYFIILYLSYFTSELHLMFLWCSLKINHCDTYTRSPTGEARLATAGFDRTWFRRCWTAEESVKRRCPMPHCCACGIMRWILARSTKSTEGCRAERHWRMQNHVWPVDLPSLNRPFGCLHLRFGYLLGGLEHLFFHILGIIIPTDYFSEG